MTGTGATVGLITLAQAAEELDVHYMTAYRYVRTGRMHAEKSGGKWWVGPDALAAVLAEGTGRRSAAAAVREPRELLVGPFTERLIAGDAAGCWDIITSALNGGAAPSEVHTKFLQPAMHEVGERWARDELSIAGEHRATATAMRLIGQLGPMFRHRGRRRGTIVLGATSGDPHSLPTAMLSDLLSDLRFDVIDLGANTPTESFIEICSSLGDMVGLGLCVVDDDYLDSAVLQAAELRAVLSDAFIVAGGGAIARSGTDRFDDLVDAVTLTGADACSAFERSLESSLAGRS